jgi:hypothetical protein
MTSYEWQPGNSYHGIVSPPYAILSYTWGKWCYRKTDPDYDYHATYPTLQVSGICWDIPAIRPQLFTPAEFQNVLNQAASRGGTE